MGTLYADWFYNERRMMCKEKIKLEYSPVSCTVKSLSREHVRTTKKSQDYLGPNEMFMIEERLMNGLWTAKGSIIVWQGHEYALKLSRQIHVQS